ncbi:MAG: LON peptidase substrate-binding domain-containing protein, partial [Acetobacteraceae bacterium]
MNDIENHPMEKESGHGELSTAEVVPVVPLRNVVVFPGMMLPLAIGREESVAAVEAAMKAERPVGLLLQRNPSKEAPGPDALHRIGTLANPLRFLTAPDGSHHLVCQGVTRFRAGGFERTDSYLTVYAERLEDRGGKPTPELEALLLALRQQALEALNLLPQTPEELVNAVRNIRAPGALADLVAGYLDIEVAEKQRILETLGLGARLATVGRHLEKQLEVLRITSRIRHETHESMGEKQREFILREQLRQIQKELGEGEDAKGAEIKDLDEKITQAEMPEAAEKQARSELKRLERMPEAAAEYSMLRTYLDWLIEFPWAALTKDNYDLAAAREVLDEDHFDLDKIKRRIVEFLAVRKRNPEGHAPLLCFVGPPGVGKTS